tara:strand:+ start:90 stop:1427 length:1338 start_codon:yes stop_codon:yes gene_type:complete
MDLDFNDAEARVKLIKHLKKNLNKVPDQFKPWAVLLLGKLEDRDAFINVKDEEIQQRFDEGKNPVSRIDKRLKKGVKELYDAINTPLGNRPQTYDTMRKNTAIPGYSPAATPQTHHGEGQKKFGITRGNAALKSKDPWAMLIEDTLERNKRGISGGNLDANGYLVIKEFHQGVTSGPLKNQGIHQFVDKIPLSSSETTAERVEQSAFEQKAAADWAGGDDVVVTDKGIESGVTRSSMLETMRKRGLVTPENQPQILQQLGELTTTDDFLKVAKEFDLPTTTESVAPFKGFQYRFGLGGMEGDVLKFMSQKFRGGAAFGASALTDADAVAELIKGNPEKAVKQAATGAVTGAAIQEVAKQAATRLPALAPTIAAGGSLMNPIGAISAGAAIGTAMRDVLPKSDFVSARGEGRGTLPEPDLPPPTLDGFLDVAKWMSNRLPKVFNMN